MPAALYGTFQYGTTQYAGAGAAVAISPLAKICLSGALDYQVALATAWSCEVGMAKPVEIDIEDYIAGDAFIVSFSITSWPAAETAATAYLTVKDSLDDADGSATYQKTVTAVAGSHGVISTTGGAGSVTGYFLISKTDSALTSPRRRYFYDVKLITSDGDPWTVFRGNMIMQKPRVTTATS